MRYRFFVTELFAQPGRPTATSIAVVTNWLANFLVGLLFAPLQVKSKYRVMLVVWQLVMLT